MKDYRVSVVSLLSNIRRKTNFLDKNDSFGVVCPLFSSSIKFGLKIQLASLFPFLGVEPRTSEKCNNS